MRRRAVRLFTSPPCEYMPIAKSSEILRGSAPLQRHARIARIPNTRDSTNTSETSPRPTRMTSTSHGTSARIWAAWPRPSIDVVRHDDAAPPITIMRRYRGHTACSTSVTIRIAGRIAWAGCIRARSA